MRTLSLLTIICNCCLLATGCATPATYSSAAYDLQHDKAIIHSYPNEIINPLLGSVPNEDNATRSAELEGDKACAEHGRHARLVSVACANRIQYGALMGRCHEYRHLFACVEEEPNE